MRKSMYSYLLSLLLLIRRRLNIVIVGANDGRLGDPAYDFVMKHSGKTDALLIEPNQQLIPYLRQNYEPHPSHQIANCAIGRGESLTLYAIRPEYWHRFRPAYSTGWPDYRAATGISSSNRAHLERALAQQGIEPDDMIVALDVPSKELLQVCDELNWQYPIDVLQIDAEGCDDLVLLASNLAMTQPKMIYFEANVLSQERLAELLQYLSTLRYRTYEYDGNNLSLRNSFTPSAIVINVAMMAYRARRKLVNMRNHRKHSEQKT